MNTQAVIETMKMTFPKVEGFQLQVGESMNGDVHFHFIGSYHCSNAIPCDMIEQTSAENLLGVIDASLTQARTEMVQILRDHANRLEATL